MRLPLSALLGLAGGLVLANLIVAGPAGADALDIEAAPEALPAGAALTGEHALPHAVMDDLLVRMERTATGMDVHFTNPGDRARTIDVRGTPSQQSGSMMSRMGPMTVNYEPRIITLTLPAGETEIWSLDLVAGQSLGLGINRAPQGAALNAPVVDVPVVDMTVPIVLVDLPEGTTLMEQAPPNLQLGGLSFETWTLDLVIGDPNGTNVRAILVKSS